MTKYYFPIRGERYVPSLKHALAEITTAIIKDQKVKIYPTYEAAQKAGWKLLFDDDTFQIFTLIQYGESDFQCCPSENENDYVWLPRALQNYLLLVKE